MRYIHPPNVDTNPILNQTLRCGSYMCRRMNDGWLLVSPSTRGWCTLSELEYLMYQKLASQPSFSITNELGMSETDKFIAALMECGLVVKSVSGSPGTNYEIQEAEKLFRLTLILSTSCNLACRYCYFDSETTIDGICLDLKTGYDAISNAFNVPHKHILIDFGEISQSFSLFQDLLIYASKLQLKRMDKTVSFAIQTNGVGISASMIDFFELHNVFVGISIDGPSQFHDKFRVSPSGKGSHLMAELTIQEIVKRRIPHIILCTVSSANVNYPKEVVDYFLHLGVNHFAFKPVIRRGSAVNDWRIVNVTTSEYKQFLTGIIDYAVMHQTWRALDIYLTQYIFRLMRDPRGWIDRCPGSRCGAGVDLLAVNPLGEFYPCPRLASFDRNPLYLGSTFKDAMQGGMCLASNSPLEQCGKCIWSVYCEGRCGYLELFGEHYVEADGFTCSIHQHICELLVWSLIPAANLINSVSGSAPGKFNLIQKDFFAG
jgi:radical SAM protein with 4Fe4S-binding SPASM domain